MDARSLGVVLLGTTLIVTAGCSGSSEPAATEADRTGSATETEPKPETEVEAEEQDEGDGDYSAISGTWTGDLICTPHEVDVTARTPYHAELRLARKPSPVRLSGGSWRGRSPTVR